MKTHFAAIGIMLLFVLSSFAAIGGSGSTDSGTYIGNPSSSENSLELSNGWTHRPVVEHFTGLSCPPCMNGAHPDLTRLWEESGYTDEQPWNYIEWHELNGGGEDDLATEDTRARMRFYQPEVSGTPCADIDGGFVEAGGSHVQTSSCSYDYVKAALEDSGNRDETDMKMVDIEVYTDFDAETRTFSIDVTVTYVADQETGDPFHDPRLNGILSVFMLEDFVTAWSKTLGEYALCRNVFREYAIEDQAFTIVQPGMNEAFHAEWEIPETMVDPDGNEIDIMIPINPLNVYPLAAVFDDDDRSSGGEDRNTDGDSHRGSPRSLQSATPKTTAYDKGNEKPEIVLPTPELFEANLTVLAEISDDSGDPDNSYLVWRPTQEANNTEEHWQIVEMEQTGAYWEGIIQVDETSRITYGVMTFDVEGAPSVTDFQYYPAATSAPQKDSGDDGFPIEYVAGGIGVIGLVSAMMVLPGMSRRKKEREAASPSEDIPATAESVESPEEYDPVGEATYTDAENVEE